MKEGPLTFRDHFLSLYQSAAAEVARQTQTNESFSSLESMQDAVAGSPVVSAAEHVAAVRFGKPIIERQEVGLEAIGVADLARKCASLGLEYLEALISGDAETIKRLEDAMVGGKCDPKWATTLKHYYEYFGPSGTRRKIPYRRAGKVKPEIIALKSGARIAIIGDWGSGGGAAREVLNLAARMNPDVLIHLGDIYYSGTEEECHLNFEKVLREHLDFNRTSIYTLSGNHDMYSGGDGYYKLIDKLNAPGSKQQASFFCLRCAGDGWQFLAMDTGLHDYSPLSVTDALTYVEEDEQTWLQARVEEFPGRTILLSHHQLFSAFSEIGKKGADGLYRPTNPKLKALFDRLQGTGKPVPAWFWGHEHNLCIYDRFADLDRGRCVGHSAIPVFVEDKPYEPLSALTDAPTIVESARLTTANGYYRNGFAFLAVAPQSTTAEYFENRGGQAHRLHHEKIE